jgi:aminopeptidase YwaD
MTVQFSGERAYEHLRVLTEEIGPRHGGSANEAKAARYIRDHFKQLGLRAKLEHYPIYAFEDAKATLRIPRGKEIPCAPLPMTTPTPARGLTRPCVFIEDSDAVCLDEKVRNQIVVMFGSFHGERQKRFHSYKPAGLVTIQTKPHQLHLRYAYNSDVKRKNGSVPTVILTLEDGLALIRNLPRRLTIKIATADEKLGHGYNVVADLKGTGPEDDVITMCAHHDSVWGGPGAVDNGGGAAAVMEFARVYKEQGVSRNMRFITFGGEETGVWGAKAYVKKLKDESDRLKKNKNFERDGLKSSFDQIRFLINLDMMGQLHGKSSAVTLGDSDIAASARLLANELRYPLTVNENNIYSSDNMMFNYAGVPSISFNRYGFEDCGGHTVADTIDHCCAEGLDHVCGMIKSWIDRYVTSPHVFPFSKKFPDAADKAVKDWFKTGNPLDYDVFTPAKRYKPKTRRKRTPKNR